MQHTLIAVFDNHNDAVSAKNELLSSGFSRDDVRLSHGNEDPAMASKGVTPAGSLTDSGASSSDSEPSIGTSIKNFFADIFGTDSSEHHDKYTNAVAHGNHVLTVNADSEPEVERAADIVERYGPVDIDEQSEKWASGAGMGSSLRGDMNSPGAGVMGVGAGGLQQSPSLSMQSDNDRLPLNQQSLNDPNPMGTTYQEPMGSHDQLSAGSYGSGSGNLQNSVGTNKASDTDSLSGTSLGASSSAGSSSLSGSSSLQGSSLEGSAKSSASMQDSSLGGSSLSGSQQRDTGSSGMSGSTGMSGSSMSGSQDTLTKRNSMRVYSRGTGSTGSALGLNDTGAGYVDDGLDDDDYRKHFSSTYGSTGDSYDDYAPAYSYGSEMARNQKYSGRQWDDVEDDLSSDWATRAGNKAGSTWAKVKAAVKHGWDRMTNDDDDAYYRNHFASSYGTTGDSYDTYKPAYGYGSDMRRDQKYSGRQWDDAETDLRSDWDSRYPSDDGVSTWDKTKAAVKHGWDRMTNDDDDSYYRNHYNSNYASSGGAYDDYAPAYRYGSDMHRDQRYSSRQWDDVENDLHTDWDSRYSGSTGSTWEKMKAAVRHGWDRMTNDDDDSYYRNHYSSSYAGTGDDFDTYKPAYSYGSEMRNSDLYRNRPWDDVEPDLRSNWDARYPNNGVSTWEKVKAAVRHGWERMTS